MSDATPDTIRALMTRHGLTQSALAHAIGADQATVSRWLSGERAPSRLLAARLAALDRDTESRVVPADLRRAVLARDEFRCVLCGSEHDLHADHLLPVSLGGETSLENLQTLCAACNTSKGGANRLPPLLRQQVRARGPALDIVPRDLSRYYALLRRESRRICLTVNEALAICDALNGSRMDATSAAFLWAEIADALPDGLAAKWDIDGPALVARLRALTPAQSLAIVDAVERWWRLPEEAGDNEDRLRAVGLIR